MPANRWLKYSWLIIPLAFLLFSAPASLDYVFHYPDEKYYTDAVLQMIEKNEWFTPYKADGSFRFLKPILTYWVLMGSYNLFGVSTFSSRIFFWIAGALLIMITWAMARSLTGSRRTAASAAIITAANPLVLMSAGRSIPDILLVLFLTISAWGFMEILVADKPLKRYYWYAYMGAAFAFETKGIPAAAFAGLSILFIVLNPWKRKKLYQVFEPVSLVASIAVALSWFIIMYIQHGTEYFSSFYTDQIGGRISSRVMQVLKNTFLGIINLIAFTMPWIVIAFSKPAAVKKQVLTSGKNEQAMIYFILTWVILIIMMAGAVFRFYDRYLLPVIPLVSLLIAILITNNATKGKQAFLTVFLVLNIFIFIISILYAVFIAPNLVLISGIALSTVIFTGWFSGILKTMSRILSTGGFILLLYFNLFALLNTLLMPNPGEQIVSTLKQQGLQKTDNIYVYGNIRTASNIRIQSHNQYLVLSMDTNYVLPAQPNHYLVFTKKEQPHLNLKNYSVFLGGEEWHRLPSESFPDFLDPAIAGLKQSGTKWYIAKPNSTK